MLLSFRNIGSQFGQCYATGPLGKDFIQLRRLHLALQKYDRVFPLPESLQENSFSEKTAANFFNFFNFVLQCHNRRRGVGRICHRLGRRNHDGGRGAGHQFEARARTTRALQDAVDESAWNSCKDKRVLELNICFIVLA